ncbi:hypothetical protein H257_19045 [Aphanomyces astaci]|uniref:Uncharacterized protein n=1 Tax=Aphanomyces astaci TaxID=112090 RepID=W4FBD3_APHAT|nr:hypothetical protein H257_19045 [Aphanomyces astaci]ETV64018.1 hypothetical protein H257_19045 [Aphanomyces astaci]|eukprot:XP_009846499.1 hypothetical protein H257_19045 [Aphanomyces astaci]
MVFASDLTFGLAPVVHRGEIMGIDKMTTLTMPPMHVVLDDFGEMETDNNSIVEATTVTEATFFLIKSKPCEARPSSTNPLPRTIRTEWTKLFRLTVSAATDEFVRLGNAVDMKRFARKTDCVSSLVHDKTLLQDRVLLLEARIDHDSV